MYIINDTIQRQLSYLIDNGIESLLLHIYHQTGAETGDITPDQQIKLDQHINEIAHIVRELIAQSHNEPVYYDIDREQFYTMSQLHDFWENADDIRDNYPKFSYYIRACLDKDGTLERI